MAADSPVEQYFNTVAGGYQDQSGKSAWAIVRRREATALMGLVGDVTGREILELGCGAGFYTRLLLAAGARNIVAVDLTQGMLDALPKERIEPVLADATRLDLGRRFALLVSAGMLEFVPEPLAALRSAARHADPGATLAILYPTRSLLGSAYRMFHRRHGFTVTLFDEALLTRLAADSGWTLDRIVPAGPFSACARLRRAGDAEGGTA